MQGASDGDEKRAKTQQQGGVGPLGLGLGSDPLEDPFIGRNVRMATGKYKGRNAFVLNRATKKYRVQVEGVPHQLEFFPKAFQIIDNEGRAVGKAAASAVNQVEFYHGWSKKHVEHR